MRLCEHAGAHHDLPPRVHSGSRWRNPERGRDHGCSCHRIAVAPSYVATRWRSPLVLPPSPFLPVYLLAATPGTERLLAHMFGPRRLNWDNVSPITSTPQRSTPKKKVPRSTTRKSGKKKHVRRALMDLGGNTPGRKAAGLRSAISTPGREVVGAV